MIEVSWGTLSGDAHEVAPSMLCPLRHIIDRVCKAHGVPYAYMISKRRQKALAHIRQEAYWRCREETTASLPEIGRAFGGRDHTTIMFGIRAYERRMKGNENG